MKSKNNKEIKELENSYNSMTRSQKATKRATDPNRKRFLLIVGSVVLALCLALGLGGFLLYSHLTKDRPIDANISIAGVPVQGMTRKEAEAAISEAFLLSHRGKQVVIKIGDEMISLTSEDTKVHLDFDALLDAAQDVKADYPQQEVFGFEEYIRMDKESVMPILQAVTDKLQSTLVESSYEVIGTAPENFDVIDETYQQKIRFKIGTPGISINPDLIYDAIIHAYAEGNFSFEFIFPIENPQPLDLEKIHAEHSVASVSAYVNEENTKTLEIIEGTYGYEFDLAAVTEAIGKASAGEELEFDYVWTEPAETKETIHNAMFCDVLGDMSTTAGWSATRNKNLKLGCEAINGIILMPGQTFSFNNTVGATTRDKGYDTGHGYLEGEVAEVVGGGICQVASTLYVACVEADLKIVERYMHAYMPSYMGASTDATIYYPYLDYKFKNDTDRPIMIEAVASGATVTCKIRSIDTRDYYVKFETVIVKNIPWKTVYKEFAPDNEEGYTDGQVISKSSPYSSVESKSYRNKYSKETNKLISSKLENHETYDSRDKVVVKIVDPNPPTDPPTTDPPTSEPTTPDPSTTEPSEPTPSETEPGDSEPTEQEPPAPEGDTPPSGGDGGITQDG